MSIENCKECGGTHIGDNACPLSPDYVPSKPWPKSASPSEPRPDDTRRDIYGQRLSLIRNCYGDFFDAEFVARAVPRQDSIAEQIEKLKNKPDSKIDTSDIPEVKDWSGAVVGKFYREPRRPYLSARADGVKGHFCIARLGKYHGLDTTEFWNPSGWSAFGYLFTDQKLAESIMDLLNTARASSPAVAPTDENWVGNIVKRAFTEIPNDPPEAAEWAVKLALREASATSAGLVEKVKQTRTAWLEQHGVPISHEFANFAEAVGNLCNYAAEPKNGKA